MDNADTAIPQGNPFPDLQAEIDAVMPIASAMQQHNKIKAEGERGKSDIEELTREGARGKVLIDHNMVALYIHKKLNTVSFNRQIWVYDVDEGIYRQNTGEVETEIQEVITRTGVECSVTREARDITYILQTINRSVKYPFNQHKDAIPVRNGILRIDFKTGEIVHLPHSSEWMFTFKFPVQYDSAAPWKSFHDNVIARYLDSFGEDSQGDDVLYQVAAQCLLQMTGTKPYKKSYILQGDANGGKTTYLEWLEALFGPDNISHCSLHQIGSDRFVGGVLEGKILNTYDDLADVPLENVGPFKTLTGGFAHQIERKHAHPYQGVIFAVHVFSCNTPPTVHERVIYDAAFWTRWEYLHFSNVFEVDPAFKEKYFTNENLSGSFNRILEVMIRISQTGLIIDSGPGEVKDSWQTSADPFARFIREHMIDTAEEHVFPKEPLLVKFQEYCRDTGVSDRKVPSILKTFTTTIFKNGFKDGQRKRVRVYLSYRKWRDESKYRITEEDEMRGADGKLGGWSDA